MNAKQLGALFLVAAALVLIVAIVLEYPELFLVSVPFSAGGVYCTYRKDWDG